MRPPPRPYGRGELQWQHPGSACERRRWFRAILTTAAYPELLGPPALQALISKIAAGKIDVVVVYKVDRLTRSGSQPSDDPAGIKNREALLTAIARAGGWVEDLVADRTTISEIAKREGKGERHIRLLLSLAFTSPFVVKTLADGAGLRCLTITCFRRKCLILGERKTRSLISA